MHNVREPPQFLRWPHPSPEKDQYIEVPPSPAKGGEGGVIDMSLSDADSDDDLASIYPAQRTGCQFRYN